MIKFRSFNWTHPWNYKLNLNSLSSILLNWNSIKLPKWSKFQLVRHSYCRPNIYIYSYIPLLLFSNSSKLLFTYLTLNIIIPRIPLPPILPLHSSHTSLHKITYKLLFPLFANGFLCICSPSFHKQKKNCLICFIIHFLLVRASYLYLLHV